MRMGRPRVAVCDPHDISRSGIVAILTASAIAAEPVTLEQVHNTAFATRGFDILVFDSEVDDERAFTRTIGRLRRRQPSLRLLLVTRHRSPRFINAALEADVHGCVLQGEDRKELLHAIAVVASGESYVSPATADALLAQKRPGRQRAMSIPGRPVNLTQREYQVMCHIARGARTRDIAKALSLSVKTIEKYRGSLRAKIGARSVAAVTAFAIAHAGLDPAELARPVRRSAEHS